MRQVRSRLHPPPGSLSLLEISRRRANGPRLAGLCGGHAVHQSSPSLDSNGKSVIVKSSRVIKSAAPVDSRPVGPSLIWKSKRRGRWSDQGDVQTTEDAVSAYRKQHVPEFEGSMISPLQQKLTDGQTVLGLWSIVANATLVEIGGRAGLDFHILDLEHGAYDIGTLEQAIRAAECGGSAPLVRLPDLTPSTFQRVLDLGAHGIIAPQIKNAKDAEAVVQCAKYAPRGMRGYNPFVRAAHYAPPAGDQQGKLDSAFGLLGIIIENQSAWADLDKICSITEIEVIYLGVYDMSMALGCHGNTKHPDVQRFISDAARRVRAAGKTLGMMAQDETELTAAAKLEARFLVYGVDSHIAYRAFKAPVDYLHNKV